jgi:hypothetical protein
MAPPHGACSRATAEALLPAGFEALCVSRTHPWCEVEPTDDALVGSRSVHLVGGEFPLILRHHIRSDRDELLFRAFLGQPLIVYGHHDDLADGPSILAETAEFISDLGPVKWSSLDRIARSRFAVRHEGSCLVVRPQTRVVEVESRGIDAIAVELRDGDPTGDILVRTSRESFTGAGPHPITDGRVTIFIRHRSSGGAPPADILRPSSPWPMVRRALTETRDRLAPIYMRRR